MSLSNILGHNRCRNDVVLETRIGVGFRYTAEDPEEVLAETFLSLHANATCSVARNKGFYLNMHEPRSLDVAAQDDKALVRYSKLLFCDR